MAKIGRNKHCPCGSGKKYKRCHGGPNRAMPPDTSHGVSAAALKVQQQRQQGVGNPIVSLDVSGQRFVAVKNRLLHSKKWKTFPDFLGDYIKAAMGADWGKAELAKPLEQRHPILVWYHHLCRQDTNKTGEIREIPMTGAIAAYLHLAYDLFTLDNNAELQEKLIKRLQLAANFEGARYEVFVASTLIRAGFEIEFEDEDDGSRSHCEFTATFKQTGRKYSVEAKCRTGNRFRLGRQLNKALAKQADHYRIVFIEINTPDESTAPGIPAQLKTALKTLRSFEGYRSDTGPLPEAYLVVTNTPWHHHLESQMYRCSALAEGFKIPDFKNDAAFPSLRAAVEARERHVEMHSLMKSMQDQSTIPSTFDGDIPEFAFGNGPSRLIVGQYYNVPDADGKEQPGLLASATVAESERLAYCCMTLANKKSVICTIPLTENEVAAWKRYPDTFFGKLEQRRAEPKDALDWYDFFLNTYSKTSKELLLDFLAGSPNLAELKKLDQSALTKVYCEGLAIGASRPKGTGNTKIGNG